MNKSKMRAALFISVLSIGALTYSATPTTTTQTASTLPSTAPANQLEFINKTGVDVTYVFSTNNADNSTVAIHIPIWIVPSPIKPTDLKIGNLSGLQSFFVQIFDGNGPETETGLLTPTKIGQKFSRSNTIYFTSAPTAASAKWSVNKVSKLQDPSQLLNTKAALENGNYTYLVSSNSTGQIDGVNYTNYGEWRDNNKSSTGGLGAEKK